MEGKVGVDLVTDQSIGDSCNCDCGYAWHTYNGGGGVRGFWPHAGWNLDHGVGEGRVE